MKSILFLILVAITRPSLAADATTGGYSGHYELARKSNALFALDVLQKNKSATTSFSAANADGSGAAPDGEGEGTFNARGELDFKWTDSFDNAGTATLRRDGKLYHLSMKVRKATEPRALPFYGEITLKLISKEPRASTR